MPVSSNYAGIVLAIDGDNTLWDTNSVFEDAQRWLITSLHRARPSDSTTLSFELLRQVDDLLILHKGRQEYDFQLLVLALISLRKGTTVAEAASTAMKEIQESPNSVDAKLAAKISRAFYLRLQTIPPLLPSVGRSLEELSRLKTCNRGRLALILFSEGNEVRIRAILESHFSGKTMFDVFHIVERKTKHALLDAQVRGSRVLESESGFSKTKTQLIVVGDSIASDIVPGNSIGAITIYIPGGYKGAEASTDEREHPRIVLKAFRELPELIEGFMANPASISLLKKLGSIGKAMRRS